MIKRVAVVKLGMNHGSGDGGSRFGIEAGEYGNSKIWRQMRSGQKKSEVFIKYEAEVSSRVGGGERGVVDFGNCLLRPMSRNSVLEEFRVRRFAVIQEEIRSRAS